MDQFIEIDNNEKLRKENINRWTLRFKLSDMEEKFCQLPEDMFKSNMVCCFFVWTFIFMCQCIMLPRSVILMLSLLLTTCLLSAAVVLVMAEEFRQLPSYLHSMSSVLVNNRIKRTLFICSFVCLMCFASTLSLILNPDDHNLIEPCTSLNHCDNSTLILSQKRNKRSIILDEIMNVNNNKIDKTMTMNTGKILIDQSHYNEIKNNINNNVNATDYLRKYSDDLIERSTEMVNELDETETEHSKKIIKYLSRLNEKFSNNKTNSDSNYSNCDIMKTDCYKTNKISNNVPDINSSNLQQINNDKTNNSNSLSVTPDIPLPSSTTNIICISCQSIPSNNEPNDKNDINETELNEKKLKKRNKRYIRIANNRWINAFNNDQIEINRDEIKDNNKSGGRIRENNERSRIPVNANNILIYNFNKNSTDRFRHKRKNINPGIESSSSLQVKCIHPEWLVFTWVLCLVALATTLKLYFVVKAMLAVLMVSLYSLLIIVLYPAVFKQRYDKELQMPLMSPMLILLVVFLILVAYHARLVEITSRLDFLWKREAERELTEMRETRSNNRQLLRNILPDHVANHFLTQDRQAEELYSQSRDNVGVMFASIPNFTEFYSEDINKGMECIRLLNEIIVDFDELLSEPRFRSIEKIKTVGACYMAASGLDPKHNSKLDELEHVCALIDFSLAMKQCLDEVNKHSFNNFFLRIGISSGPVVGGVIGARKPVYDVWGNTVNEASRMDSTGSGGRIQVPKHTATILAARGYIIEYRGVVAVKGKGDMETYFVEGRGTGDQGAFIRHPSQHNSLAAVVYGMVQARRRKNTIKRPHNSQGLLRTKSQHHSSTSSKNLQNDSSSPNFQQFLQNSNNNSPQIYPDFNSEIIQEKPYSRKINFSSFRIHNKSSPNNPLRRNTTRIFRNKSENRTIDNSINRNDSIDRNNESNNKSNDIIDNNIIKGQSFITVDDNIDKNLSINNNRSAPQTPLVRTQPHRSISMNFSSHSNINVNEFS